jgi:tRNA(His) 5'-end guanylyltransferase
MNGQNALSKWLSDHPSDMNQDPETCDAGVIAPDTIVALTLVVKHPKEADSLIEDYPYGKNFTKALLLTARDLMKRFSPITLAYVHGNEIILIEQSQRTRTARRRSEILSTLVPQAVLAFLENSGTTTSFDGRIREFGTKSELAQFMMWRRGECHRKAISGALYRALRRGGHSEAHISSRIEATCEREQVELLERLGAPITSTSIMTRRGSLLSWRTPMGAESKGLEIHFNTKLPDRDHQFKLLLALHLDMLPEERGSLGLAERSRTNQVVESPARSMHADQSKKHRSLLPIYNRRARVSVLKIPAQ